MTDHDLKPSDAVLSASQALRFLADAGQVLSSSLDYEQTLRRVAQLAVPEFADWCAVFLTDEAGVEERDHQPAPRPRARGDAPRDPPSPPGGRRRLRVAPGRAHRRAVLAHDVRGAAATDLDAEQRRVLERLAPKSYMLVPLARAGAQHRVADAALDPGRPPLHRGGPRLRPDRSPPAARSRSTTPACTTAAERSLSLLDTVFATAPVGLAFVDPDLRFVRVNETLRGLQRPPGRGPRRADDPGGPGRAGRRARAAVPARPRHGPAAPRPRAQRRERRRAGRRAALERLLHAGARPRRRPARRHRRGPRRHRAPAVRWRPSARRAPGRTSSRAPARCSTSRWTTSETLRAVADIAVPEIADWCAVSVLDERRRPAAGRRRARRPRQRELGERAQPPLPGRPRVHAPARCGSRARGETELVREVTDEMLVAGIPDPEQLDLVRRLGLRSVIIAALQRARPDVRHADPRQRRVEPALRAGRRPARRGARRARAAMAIDNARLYTERTPHRPHAAGQAPARAPAGDPGRADGRPLPRGRRAQRGRRRLLRRLPALAGPSGRSWSATSRARAPRPPPSPRWRATRCAPRRSRTTPPSGACGGSTPRCSTTTSRRSSRPSCWPTCPADRRGPDRRPPRRSPGTRPACRPPRRRASSMRGTLRDDARPARGRRRSPPPTHGWGRGRAAALHRRRHRGGPADAPVRRAGPRRAAGDARGRAAAGRVVDAVEQAVVDAQAGEPRDDIALLALALPAEDSAGRRAG